MLDPKQHFRECGPGEPVKKSLACTYRGKSNRKVDVKSCCGSKSSLPIWECKIYGECSKGRKVDGVPGHCQTCQKIKAPAAVASAVRP